MDNLKTYEFGADAGSLSAAHEAGVLPERWEGAFRTLVSEIVSMVGRSPTSVYLCSADEDADARNHFAFVLARLLREHVPGVVLVDCDFLSAGMSGIVPHRDALGFLDLLLYGTSLGVITQQAAHGAKVVGAGSFTVTKKSPFAMDSFTAARRYLANQAKCVLFVGPATDDEENVHPIAHGVDVVTLVRVAERFDARTLDPLERSVASIEGVEARSIRLNTGTPVAGPGRGAGAGEPMLTAEAQDLLSVGPRETRGAPRMGRPQAREGSGVARPSDTAPTRRPGLGAPLSDAREIPGRARARGASGSRAVRVITSLVAVVAVVFVVWWLYLTRSVREPRGPEGEVASPAVSVDSPPRDSSRAGTPAGRPETDREPGAAGPEVTPVGGEVDEVAIHRDLPAGSQTGEMRDRGPGVAYPSPDSLLYVETLDRFADQYVIHVSSFRGKGKATEEGLYLLGWGYPVFIYHVDLGSKGKWYRVYVGPFATRDNAMGAKIKLDENPRITSTRVSKVPG